MDFINAPIGLSTLLLAVVARVEFASGKGLPIAEKLRPLIASEFLTMQCASWADPADSSYNRGDWVRNYGHCDFGHHLQKLQDRYCQPRDETCPWNR